MVGDREDAVDVVLDQQHRQIGGDRLDQVADALALGGGQAGQRLVEQQHARACRQRQRHVEQALPAIAQRAGFGGLDAAQAHGLDHAQGLLVDGVEALGAAPGVEALLCPRLHGQPDIFRDREGGEEVGDLEGAADAGLSDRLGRHARRSGGRAGGQCRGQAGTGRRSG